LQFSFTDKIFLKPDFLKGSINYRLQRAQHEKHLKKAIGKNKEPQLILDGTAGLLSDTLILLSLGHKVIACEQSKYIYLLVSDAVRRAVGQLDFLENLILVNQNSIDVYLKKENIDIVYLDPLFPQDKKQLKRSKSIYALRDILKLEKIATNDDKLFIKFNELKPKKIILKRPLKSEIIYNTPNYQVKGKSTRFDIYI
jgi:16S rRNA (guanine1516-N2)-methyltransferase